MSSQEDQSKTCNEKEETEQHNDVQTQDNQTSVTLLSELNDCTKEEIIKKYLALNQENQVLREKVVGIKSENQTQRSDSKGSQVLSSRKSRKVEKSEKKAKELFNVFQCHQYAIKLSYVGVNYQGLAYQASTENTIEEFFFKALEKMMMIQSRDTCNFTRSGRTDRGVSALGQVFSIQLRTSIKKSENPKSENKLDYLKMINSNLPEDIRVLSVKKVDDSFNARFDCVKRVYKYFFFENDMDISKIREAASLFLGEHDFRNYCKIDVLQTMNYMRTIYQLDIEEIDIKTNDSVILDPRHKLYVATIVGNAFLWHQIRNIMGILFLVGKRLEVPELITELLDIEKNPSKPNYDMAADFPLILYDCTYDKVKFDYNEPQVKVYDHYLKILQKREIENQLFMAPLNYLKTNSLGASDPYNMVERSIVIQKETLESKTYRKLSTRQKAITSEESFNNLKGRKLEKYQIKKEKQIHYQQMRNQALELEQSQILTGTPPLPNDL